MTVPGKGGRPRKWRSDADRVRAYRARQRDLPEPPTLVAALDDGDELARALEQVRELGERVAKLKRSERSLRQELKKTSGELEQQKTRFDWIESDNERLRKEIAALRAERPLSRAERRGRDQEHRRR